MSATMIFPVPVHFPRGATGIALYPAPNSVVNDSVNPTTQISASKLEKTHSIVDRQVGSAADEVRPMWVAQTAGTIDKFEVGAIAKAVGDATATIDLKKNGSSILTSPITLDSGDTNRVVKTGSLSAASFVSGDFFEVEIDATIGTGTLPTGLLWKLQAREDRA